jgi:hypothetical protein
MQGMQKVIDVQKNKKPCNLKKCRAFLFRIKE